MTSILLLSAYRADSHAYWVRWLQREFDDLQWRVLELPGRHFAWRIRGNPLSWLDALPDVLDEDRPDLLLATSMVDLATIRGLHPRLADIPTLLYFHENQFAYPLSEDQVRSVEPQMVQIYAALAADRLAFNSAFNRNSFLEGVDALLARMPDHVPAHVPQRLAEKSSILPVGIDSIEPVERKDPRLVVWNHRWEYDKGPDLFADTLLHLAENGVDFQVALLGSRGRRAVPALQHLRDRLADRIVADDFLPRDGYRAMLTKAAVCVSTAQHEFQGISMLEAVSAGCLPIVPDDLCYREQFPSRFRYTPGSLDALASLLRKALEGGLAPPPDVAAWSSPEIFPAWQQALNCGE